MIKNIASALLPDCKVFLFGSRARQDNRIDSDYDIMLIVKNDMNPKEKMEFRSKIRNMLADKKIYSDIIIQSEAELEIKKKIPGNVVYYGFPEAVLL